MRPFDAGRFVDAQARAAFVERLVHDGTVSDYLLRLKRADGTPLWVEITARADVPTLDGSFRVEALVRDVSDRKRLEDQTRDLYHQLLQAEKLAALGQTVSGVAHELNNPLATIMTRAERLIERPHDEDTRRGLEIILSESDRAARIVRNLLTFARKRHTTRSQVDLNTVVSETLAAPRLRAACHQHRRARRAGGRPAARLRRSTPVTAGAAQPRHQRRAGDARRPRTRHARGPHLARRRSGRGRPRGQRRRPGRVRRDEDKGLRPVLHDQGRRQGNRARTLGGLRDRPGARRPDLGRELRETRGLVLRRAADERRRHARSRGAATAGAAGGASRHVRAARGGRTGACRRGRRGAGRRRVRGGAGGRRRGGA